jgi:hypothetical protein
MTQPIPNAPAIRRLVELGLKVKPNTPSVGDSTIDILPSAGLVELGLKAKGK